MATRRGRPTKAVQKQLLHQGASEIADEFRRLPLRQPVDARFFPYYQRVLEEDLAAVLEYCDRFSFSKLDSSFYELLGRLVQLQSLVAAKQIISEVMRRDPDPSPPAYVVYSYWYKTLKPLCKDARQFIRSQYKKDDSVKREHVWQAYIAGSRNAARLDAFATTPDRITEQLPSLYDVVCAFTIERLLPKEIFFQLAESSKRSDARAERDRRYRSRRFRQTPSSIARQYACEIVGISVSAMSHKNVGN